MRAAKPVLTVLIAATLFGLGADGTWRTTRPVRSTVEPPPGPAEVIVFRAKHYQTKGACIQIGDTLAMPVVEGFEVVEVVRGELPAKRVQVRPLSGSGHLGGLGHEEACTLRLIRSAKARGQPRQEGEDGSGVLWVDGSALSIERSSR